MKCREIKKNLQSFINNELDENFTQKINSHLKECDSCKKDYEFFKKYFYAVSKIKPVKAPDDLIGKLNEKIYSRKFYDKIITFISYNFKFNYKTLSFALILILAILTPINYFNYTKKIKENKLNSFAKNDSATEIARQIEKPSAAKSLSGKTFAGESAKKNIKTESGQKTYQVTLLITDQVKIDEEPAGSLALDKNILSKKESSEILKIKKDADDEKNFSEPAKSENKKASDKMNSTENKNRFAANAKPEMQKGNNSEQKNSVELESLIKLYNGKIIKNEKNKENENINFEIPEAKYQEFLNKVKSLGNAVIKNDKNNNISIELNYQK